MKHSVYLIDYENVSYKGLYGIGNIESGDEILIFYSGEIDVIKDILSAYTRLNIKIKYVCLEESGKNALDFMITVYIGYFASQQDIERVAVISKDKGYTSIKSVVNDINKELKLYFENCIYNIIFPDKAVKSDSEIKLNSLSKAVKSVLEIKLNSLSREEKRQYIINLIKHENKIPDKYIQNIASHVLNNLGNKENFTKCIDKQIGTKTENQVYKKEALKYFNMVMKMV